MYEPDLDRIKRLMGRDALPPLVMPATLPPAMTARGYRLEAGMLYWERLPMSDVSARGAFKVYGEEGR